MRTRLSLILVLGAASMWLAPPCESAPGAGRTADAPVPATGDWISIPYAEKVMVTRSPIAAAESSPPLALTVTRTATGTLVSATSFHEVRRMRVVKALPGTPATLVLAQAEDAPRPGDETFTAPVAILKDGDAEELQTTLGMEAGRQQRFRRLPGSVDAWAAEVLLAGEYTDAGGRSWSFGTDLRAKTPEGAYRYTISLDPSEAGCDYFRTPDPKAVGGERRTGFKWDGPALHLYRIEYGTGGPPIACAREPFAVLTRAVPSPSAAPGPCSLEALPIDQKTRIDATHFVSRADRFTLEHVNASGEADPSQFTDAPIAVVHADGTRCEFDPTIYGHELWATRDQKTIAVVSYSGSSADLLFVDVGTCKEKARLNVYGSRVKVEGDLVTHGGDCEMENAVRGACVPASVWRLGAACVPQRLEAASVAWTRERFGVGFSTWSVVAHPFTPEARWQGLAPAADLPGSR